MNELQARVGSFWGWGRGAVYGDPAYNSTQQFELDGCVASGIRQVIHPPPIEGTSQPYDWSWLKPTATLGLQQGVSAIPLPDDFGGFEGEITLVTTAGLMWGPIRLYNEGEVRVRYSLTPATTGRPLMAAIQPLKGTTPTQGQRFQLIVFPLPDTNYTMQFQYYLLPDYLTGATPYPLGGAGLAELYIESCLAIAESRLDDMAGVHAAAFQQRLMASIGLDRRNKPQTLGYNRDRSDGPNYRNPFNHYQDRILYNGQQY